MDIITSILNKVISVGASDLHLSSGLPAKIRLYGKLQQLNNDILTEENLLSILKQLLTTKQLESFIQQGDLDFAFALPCGTRFRTNCYKQQRGTAIAFRKINTEILGLEELGLPSELASLVMRPKGLILITGPTGSGKSTTLAALVDYANRHRTDHIITIEDPIEYVFTPDRCLVNQREVGEHTQSFSAALRGALREDPDIILVGEMRDLETITLALEAAETGHLVLSTLHTMSAAKSMNRIIEVFPSEMQRQIRSSLAETLTAVISQTLFSRIDEAGRIPAVEILTGTPAVRNLIREGKIHQLPSVIQTSSASGMRLMDDSIVNLLQQEIISNADAWFAASDTTRLENITPTNMSLLMP